MGIVNYLQRFGPQLADLSTSLRDLLNDGNEFFWEQHHDGCLQDIKFSLTSAPVLGYFDPNDEVTLECDASDHGLGACIKQRGQPIGYASKAMTSAETTHR